MGEISGDVCVLALVLTATAAVVVGTWAAYVLPYIEEASVYGQINFKVASWYPVVTGSNGGTPFTDEANPDWVSRQFSFYLCPSDIGPQQHEGLSRFFAHGNSVAKLSKKYFSAHARTTM